MQPRTYTPRTLAVRDTDVGFGMLPWACGPQWELQELYWFQVAVPGYEHLWYKIPAGYLYDKASTPWWIQGPPLFYTPEGRASVPALEHDFLCDLLLGGSDWLKVALEGELPECPPAWVIHEHFRVRMHHWQVRPWKAAVMGLAVAWFGPKGTGWPWLTGALLGFDLWALGQAVGVLRGWMD